MSDVAVVTGTSSGMGLYAAVELARAGLMVVATMRDPARSANLRRVAEGAGVELDVRARRFPTEAGGPYADLLAAYASRTQAAFANAQSASSAGAAIAAAATASSYRFRWQTSDQARTFVGSSLADLDGARVLGITRT